MGLCCCGPRSAAILAELLAADAAIVADSVFFVPIAAVSADRIHIFGAGAAVGAVGAERTYGIWGAGAAIFAFSVFFAKAAVRAVRLHLELFKAVLSAEPGQ